MPVEIMGFRSLKEFSSDPEVKDLLQESVKKNWAENAMSIQGLSMVTGSDSQGEDYYTNLFNDVESRLKRNQQPAMVFNKEGEATAAHTVLMSGSGVDKKTGERYLCVRDNNFDANTIDKCQKKMFLTKAGKVRYEFLTPYVAPAMVGKMKMSYTENSNTVEQMKNLKTHCLNSKNCNSTASVTK